MFRPPQLIWALIVFGVAMALPLPRAQHSLADADGKALQPLPANGGGKEGAPAPAGDVDTAGIEARVLARLRHQVHGEVDQIAMRSIERAMRRLGDRNGGEAPRPIGKGLRLTFALVPEIAGAAPVSVLTRTTSYSAFADTVLGGTVFRLNVAGEVCLKGVHHDRVAVDFSTLLQFEDTGNEESGSSGATGSAELVIGEPEVLMSVGARDLVLTVDEVGLP